MLGLDGTVVSINPQRNAAKKVNATHCSGYTPRGAVIVTSMTIDFNVTFRDGPFDGNLSVSAFILANHRSDDNAQTAAIMLHTAWEGTRGNGRSIVGGMIQSGIAFEQRPGHFCQNYVVESVEEQGDVVHVVCGYKGVMPLKGSVA
jgi:hypothetical protein